MHTDKDILDGQLRTCSQSTGRGTVVTGRVEAGIVNVGDEVEIVGIKDTH